MGFWRSRVVWIWMLALVVGLLVIVRSTFTTDMSAFLPQSPSKQQQLLVDQITVGSVSRMLLVGLEGGTQEQRELASQALAGQMRASDRFSIVANGSAEAFEKDRVFLFENRYLLSPAVSEGHFSVEGLRQSVTHSVDMLGSPAGMLLKEIFPRDPTGELLALVDELDSADRPAGANVWLSKDGRRAILMAQTSAAGSDTDAQEQALASVRQAFAEVQAKDASLQPVRLLLSGAPVFSVDARNTIRSEAMRLSVAGFLAVLTLLLLVYRSPLTVGMSLVPVFTAVVMGIAAVSLVFGVVHGITVGFGTTLIGEAVDYSIYYFVQSGKTGSGGAAGSASWAKRFWPTIRLGVLTSVFGFAALVFAGFPGLAQLGLYSITGLCTAAMVTRYVLPELPARPVNLGPARRLGQWLTRRVAALRRLRPLVLLVALLAAGVLVWTSLHGSIWNRALSGLSPVSQEAQDLDESLRRDLGQPDLRYLVVVSAPDQETLLRRTEQVSSSLLQLVDDKTISGFETPTRYLPSAATQNARRAAMPDPAELQARLDQALEPLPVRADTLQPFAQDLERARQQPLITPESLKGTALALTLEAMLVQRENGWSALLPLRSPVDAQGKSQEIDGAAVQRVLDAGASPLPGTEVLFLDITTETRDLYSRYFNEALLLSLAGLLAIVVLLAWSLKSGQRLLRVLTPILLAEIVVVAGLVLLGERLTLLHLIGLLLVVAVGSNYTLFFDRYDLENESESITMVSLLVANLAAVFGFGVLAFSQVPVLRAIGATVGPGAVIALLFAAILTRKTGAAASSGEAQA